jgi:hypothetical protein
MPMIRHATRKMSIRARFLAALLLLAVVCCAGPPTTVEIAAHRRRDRTRAGSAQSPRSVTAFPCPMLHAQAGHRERAIERLRRVVYRAHGGADTNAVQLLETLEAGAKPN